MYYYLFTFRATDLVKMPQIFNKRCSQQDLASLLKILTAFKYVFKMIHSITHSIIYPIVFAKFIIFHDVSGSLLIVRHQAITFTD